MTTFTVNMLELGPLYRDMDEAIEFATLRYIYLPDGLLRPIIVRHGDSFTLNDDETIYLKTLIDSGQQPYISYTVTADVDGGGGNGGGGGGGGGNTGVPSAPSNIRLAPGGNDPPGDFLIIEWDAPADEGTSPVTNYRIFYKPTFFDENFQDFVEFAHDPDPTTTITITGLEAGRLYTIYIIAVSDAGESDPSESVDLPTWAPN